MFLTTGSSTEKALGDNPSLRAELEAAEQEELERRAKLAGLSTRGGKAAMVGGGWWLTPSCVWCGVELVGPTNSTPQYGYGWVGVMGRCKGIGGLWSGLGVWDAGNGSTARLYAIGCLLIARVGMCVVGAAAVGPPNEFLCLLCSPTQPTCHRSTASSSWTTTCTPTRDPCSTPPASSSSSNRRVPTRTHRCRLPHR